MSKNVDINKLDDTINEYNNTHHRTIKMKLVHAKSSTYIDFNVESNDKDPKWWLFKNVKI